MAILEKYYEIIDRPSIEVSRMWKLIHIFCLALASVFGFSSSFTFAKVMEHFLDNCWLYPNIIYKYIPQNDSVFLNFSFEIKIDLVGTQWGPSYVCNIIQYVPLVSFILGPILIAFFLMYPRGGTNFNKSCSIERSWHLVFPSALITILYIIFLIYCFSIYSRGASAFCSEFDKIIDSSNSDQCNKLIEKFTIELTTSNFFPSTQTFNLSVSAKIALSMCLLCFCIICWIFEIISLVLRMIYAVDFKILEVVIKTRDDSDQIQKTLQNEKETDSDGSESITIKLTNY